MNLRHLLPRESGQFILGKLKRLGIPWLVVTIGVMPVLDYIHFTAKTGDVIGYGEYFLDSLHQIAKFHFGWLKMDAYSPMTEHFYQRYVWFISLLLLFFGAFAMLYKIGAIKIKTSKRVVQPWLALVIGGVVSIVPFALVKLFTYDDMLSSGWFSLGNLFQFQLGKVFVYAVYFVLGVCACINEWFKSLDL